MLKKLLFTICLFAATVSFSQEVSIDRVTTSPNPFATKTNISFTLSSKENVTLIVKNILGKTVLQKTINGSIGKNTIPFYKNNLVSGVYIYAIKNKKYIVSKRFVIQ